MNPLEAFNAWYESLPMSVAILIGMVLGVLAGLGAAIAKHARR